MLARLTFTALLIAPLSAHDMWIEPASFFPTVGQSLTVKLRVGQDLVGDPLPRDPSLIRQFVIEDGSGPRTIPGRTGMNPAGVLRVNAPGLLVLGYHSHPSIVDQDAAKFNAYLKEEGLDAALALRVSRRQMDQPVRETFSRCAKSLLLSGPVAHQPADRTLGFPLELVAERNPYALRGNEALSVRLLHEGRPLAGALVVAMNRLHPAEKLTARTGRDGRVSLRLHPGGMWLVKAVHIVPAAAGSDASWHSYWASLTFELKAGS